MGVSDLRLGGNYTQPDPMPNPKPGARYIAYVGHVEVGRFAAHQEAERRVKQAFDGDLIFIDATKDIV